MAYSLFHATIIIYRTTPSRLAPSSTTGTLLKVFLFVCLFLITCTLKQDDLAAATSLTELEQNFSSRVGLSKITCLFVEIPKYFYFV